MMNFGLSRSDCAIAVGGGVVGDLTGFSAASYMRGIDFYNVPTTLLSQVDSSIGGKTAVNLGSVKNIVGAFYQPQEVLVDPAFLKTLPAREVKCGVGEIVKYAALSGEIFDLLEGNTDKLTDLAFLETLIISCIQHKAGVVERDEKENGERRSLNVGHTTGHAIELSTGLSHGESVLYGMRFETQMAMEQGVCEREYGKRLLAIVDAAIAQAPVKKVDFSNIEEDARLARSDKKNTEDGEIKMAVAKGKSEWSMLSLPFEVYKKALKNAVNSL
jgi:3-dehydroquinate synthase